MAHVSKYIIPEEDTEEMSRQLFEILTNVGNKEETREFLRELLTPTEQIMLSKRLATIAMLHDNKSSSAIRDYVNVSSSTTRKLYAKNVDGEFTAINNYLSKKNNKKKISRFIKFLIVATSPNARTRRRSELVRELNRI